MSWPSVGVVIPTRNRPELLRAGASTRCARRTTRAQLRDRRGRSTRPSRTTCWPPPTATRCMVLANWRTPGLAGARNTGHPGAGHRARGVLRRRRPVGAGQAAPAGRRAAAEPARVRHLRDRGRVRGPVHAAAGRNASGDASTTLARSRMAMLHSSTFLIRRAALADPDAHRAGRRGRAGQPERGLGPAAAGRPPGTDRAPGRAAGAGAVGPHLALRVRVRTRRSPRCAG